MEPRALINYMCRPRNSHKVIASSPAMEHHMVLLNQHVVVVTAVGTKAHAASPLSIGRALEKELNIPPHLLRVTNHDPEDFFVYFTMPVHDVICASPATTPEKCLMSSALPRQRSQENA
ncbi:Histidyl-tRNA synthetase [Hordeum vulgare]|nr:Histidyl-tRNA synthetase [Hordeum vulgare]